MGNASEVSDTERLSEADAPWREYELAGALVGSQWQDQDLKLYTIRSLRQGENTDHEYTVRYPELRIAYYKEGEKSPTILSYPVKAWIHRIKVDEDDSRKLWPGCDQAGAFIERYLPTDSELDDS